MFNIKIADLIVHIENQYEYVRHLCRNYWYTGMSAPDFSVRATEEDIQNEIHASKQKTSPAYAEGVCIYRNLCRQLPLFFQAYLMHCAVIEYQGRGYAFAAKSGTGKSTHISQWQKKFGESVHIVNGDKPILRFKEDALITYGTPWCGKEGWNQNTSVPLSAICFLERASENTIRRILPDEAIGRIFHQILTPQDLPTVDALVPLLDKTLRQIPCYVLGCTISEEAAEVAYLGMKPLSEIGKDEML